MIELNKMSVGKSYVTRNGQKAIIRSAGIYGVTGTINDFNVTWANSGRLWNNPRESVLDIVGEWVEPKPAEEATEWKVGDEVEVVMRITHVFGDGAVNARSSSFNYEGERVVTIAGKDILRRAKRQIAVGCRVKIGSDTGVWEVLAIGKERAWVHRVGSDRVEPLFILTVVE